MQKTLCNVARFLPNQAEADPLGIAVKAPLGRTGDRIRYQQLTFRGLENDSNSCAHLLCERGIERGMRVLLMVRPGLDLIRCVFALFKIGAVPVVIDPGMGLKSFLACVRRTQPEAIVGIPLAVRISRIFKDSFRTTRLRVAVGDRRFRREMRRHHDHYFEVAETRADELAAILFTSGSTGAPKGVRYEHGMFEAQVRLLRQHYGIEAGEVDLPMLPVFALFNPALGMTTVTPQMNPSRPAKANPWNIVQAIQQNEVTNSFGSPVLWTRIADYCERRKTTLPSLRRILMAGASAPPALIARYRIIAPNAIVHTPYGATECLPLSSASGELILGGTAALSAAGKGTCVGIPMDEIDIRCIRITDDAIDRLEDSLQVPTGSIGEIVACGPVVTKEYDQLPEATAAAKMKGPDGTIWHRMGDLGYFDSEGRLWFCGRKAERVECGGRLYLTDCCEAIFNAHPDVFRTALIGLQIAGEKRPALVVEPKPGKYPRTPKQRRDLIEELKVLGDQHLHTRDIEHFYFERRFPVDVRHNAKIHRLSLGRKYQEKLK